VCGCVCVGCVGGVCVSVGGWVGECVCVCVCVLILMFFSLFFFSPLLVLPAYLDINII